jgi:hypothetical protein
MKQEILWHDGLAVAAGRLHFSGVDVNHEAVRDVMSSGTAG